MKKYQVWEYEDETSEFDPKGKWIPGTEYYSRTYKVKVPTPLLQLCQTKNDFSQIYQWIEENASKNIWIT
jgi:hypothetical protein